MKLNRTNPILQYISEEEKRYKELFKVTEKFHSTMDINGVLEEIIHTLKQMFPQYSYVLLLSNDHDAAPDLPIKDLEYNSENAAAISAYVNGTVEIEQGEFPVLYAPLKGRQGVYGVLQVSSRISSMIRNSQIEFIRLLAYTAGSALENAKLYQQARKLNEDLRFINETSHKLNSTSTLSETIEYLHSQVTKSFQTSAIGFIWLSEDGPEVLNGSCKFFQAAEGKKLIETILLKLEKEKEALFIGDAHLNSNTMCCGYGALMAVPMLTGESLTGMAIALGDESYSFTFETFKLFQSLIHRSTLALTNSMLRERLERTVITDQLTQLYARNYLNKMIEDSMNRDREGTFIMIDLDDFKSVNDTYGHQVGDDVLIQVANLINEKLRSTDIGARWGGEELAVYLPGVPISYGLHVAERLVKNVAENTDPPVTISCGISNWAYGQQDELKHLVKRADSALYEAKNSGKNRIIINSIQILAN